MSNAASNYLENSVLDHILKNTVYAQPAGLYIGLFTADAGELEAGTLTSEVTGGAYARKAITFAASSAGTAASNATVTFDTATADWGTVTHVAIIDAASAGNVLFWGALTATKTVNTGDTFQISSGNMTVSLA